MPDLSKRASTIERMDDLDVSGSDLRQALSELEGINYALGGNYVTLKAIAMVMERYPHLRYLRIADVGCGSGDMLKRIRRMMEKRKMEAELSGFDANPNVVKYAMEHTPEPCRISYAAVNIFSDDFMNRKFDIVTGTLFFHHFTNDQLAHFFKKMRDRTSLAIVINDIHRHWFAYYAIKILTRIFSRSSMVKHDAPVSVLRAFKKAELVQILRMAGLHDYRIKWCWAFRWQVVVWLKSAKSPG
ncbi:MAG TPA: methyltransferase domain-containing protein [Chryseosolibacter sp.]|nr:methyltransferase domain-containing protein [Chryseosolibacter sp.]